MTAQSRGLPFAGRPLHLAQRTTGCCGIRLSIRNRSECGGEALSIPIEGSAAITETGASFDEGTFASGIATYGISGDRPAGRRRGGRISLTAPDCTPIDTTWAATRPSIVIGDRCDTPQATKRLRLSRLKVTAVSCRKARRAATQWARHCFQAQRLRGETECTFSSGARHWRARVRIVGGPGLGGYSRITLRSGNARAIFYARAQATQ
jgi:hypothetical protein